MGMTDRYLKKPPFRFLHDAVMEVTRSTSFAQGLFTPEESDAAQLTDKAAKVEFLNKAINVTCIALNEKIDVSASKIVAGLEAEKTNDLPRRCPLQLVGFLRMWLSWPTSRRFF